MSALKWGGVFCVSVPGEEACVIAWELVGKGLWYAFVAWCSLLFSAVVLLVVLRVRKLRALRKAVAEELWDDEGNTATAYPWRDWEMQHKGWVVVLKFFLQFLPSMFSVMQFVYRAIFQEVWIGGLALDAVCHSLYAVGLLIRWLKAPKK
jgi:hypothetical protein